ncbi:MAG: hypothetical protein KZQ99_21830 [Candidatus Thiodiazotropha sp. (ex Dulcina madagascariensis)]|nr:hypothetical protein [Candidatus Thiodiazotropha sp. (ex Dulcina madagascariensis)]
MNEHSEERHDKRKPENSLDWQPDTIQQQKPVEYEPKKKTCRQPDQAIQQAQRKPVTD